MVDFPPPGNYTPVLRQYLEQRAKTGDAILFFRLGDFYECFFADAELIAKELEITLTARADQAHPNGKVPMAGIPVKTAEAYTAKLLKAGFKVAICEQVGDPRGKGPMQRELVRILTPGTLIETEFIGGEQANYLAAIFPQNRNKANGSWGLAFVDITTAELKVTELSESQLLLELIRIKPSELLVPSCRTKDPDGIYLEQLILPEDLNQADYSITSRAVNLFDLEIAKQKIKEKFGVHSLEGFGCADYQAGIQSIGALLDYLDFTCPESITSLDRIQVYETSSFLKMDEQTIKNLELFETLRQRSKKGSLLGLMEDNVTTKMGIRKMKEWLSAPSLDAKEINNRQNAVRRLVESQSLLSNLTDLLSQVTDLERLNVKLKTNRLNPRELGWIKNSLLVLPGIKALLKEINNGSLNSVLEDDNLDNLLELEFSENLMLKAKELDYALFDELPVTSGEGRIFKQGYSQKLDEIRKTVEENDSWLINYEKSEKEKTGCKSLRVTFNKAAGFYIELSKANKNLAPGDYKIKQNLTNVDRYITNELKEHESKYLLAEASLKNIEQEIFSFLRESLASFWEEIKLISSQLAKIDCLLSFAILGIKNNYLAPKVNDSLKIQITEGRHPVLETMLPTGYFVSNDLQLEGKGEQQVVILTGPNMSGKSTFMKQSALICILAQIGCYVPASFAEIGITDRIFTRIGASDDMNMGQSTFMVEMTETAYLLNNLTERSLILLDEIGRGTSTYDGVAIAWSVAEHIAKGGARTVFATHYHELNNLSDIFKQVVNYQVSVHEGNGELVFLHKVKPGGANRSYGIEVARMAGLPKQVLDRAQSIMSQMNSKGLPAKRTALVCESIEQAKLELDRVMK
ncbi:MAG: DNA mismatch repair protein MutS [Candidatus Caenarcaniphilales bacterium]|nr:DNA mismatch repair protein MutS [Candidatus Caenarcaniphilales bacterium]